MKDKIILIYEGNKLIHSQLINDETTLQLPVLPLTEYRIEVIDVETEKLVKELNQRFEFGHNMLRIELDTTDEDRQSAEFYKKKIVELIEATDFDDYYKKLLTILSRSRDRNLLSKKDHAWLRGGRLEYLFTKYLTFMEYNGEISDLKSGCTVDSDGIAHPAPGGKKGDPDITFRCEGYYCALELTTIRGADQQWKAEGSSVPYHIQNFIEKTGHKNVIGIFSPPETHERVSGPLLHGKLPAGHPIRYISIYELLDRVCKNGIVQTVREISKELIP